MKTESVDRFYMQTLDHEFILLVPCGDYSKEPWTQITL